MKRFVENTFESETFSRIFSREMDIVLGVKEISHPRL